MIYVCDGCKIFIDNMYEFCNTCLCNNNILWKYISTLRLEKTNKLIDSIVVDSLSKIEILECDSNKEISSEFEKIG